MSTVTLRGVDHLKKAAAAVLANDITSYWLERGYRGVQVWREPMENTIGLYQIRSNIGPNGYPPRD